jgi:uncharacterized protein (TIGR00369 family)
MCEIKDWVESSAYSNALGVQLDELTEEGAALHLPFKEENSNPGGALHGGVYASLSIIGAQANARQVLGGDVGPFHTTAFQINYLSAAINEGVRAKARLLRRGKELAFVEVVCTSDAGKDVSHATLMIRGRKGAIETSGPAPGIDAPGTNPGDMGPAIAGMVPFISERGIQIEHMEGGTARLAMPWKDAHLDNVSGGTHEGAALALLDTAGAMAGWAVTGAGPYKASTPSMQAQVIEIPPAEDLVAHARVAHQDNEIFYSDVEVSGVNSQRVCARGTILYRIVT